MSTTTTVIVIAVWVTAGVLPALVMMRRGHRSGYWILIGVGLGPFTAPILWERMESDRPEVLRVAEGAGSARERSLVVALDGSASDRRAIDFLESSVDPSSTAVTLVTVTDFDADERARDAASDLLHAAAAELERFAPEALLLTGAPLAELLALVERDRPDLIVVGAKGSGLSKRLLGSVSEGLLASSVVPVVVLPEDGGRPDQA